MFLYLKLSTGHRKENFFRFYFLNSKVWNNVKIYKFGLYCHLLQAFYVFYHPTDSGAVSMTSENIDMTLGKCLSCSLNSVGCKNGEKLLFVLFG